MSTKTKNLRRYTKTIPLIDLREDVGSKIEYNEFREIQFQYTAYVEYWMKHFSEKFFEKNPLIRLLVIKHSQTEWRISANKPLTLTAIMTK